MDLQVKLVNDGHVRSATSRPERGGLPARAVWRDEAWGTTFEPAVIVYNRRHRRACGCRAAAAARRGCCRTRRRAGGRVVTYDVEKSAGYLLAQQDARMGSEFLVPAQALDARACNCRLRPRA